MKENKNISANQIREEEDVVKKRQKKVDAPIQNVLNGTFLIREKTLRMLPFLLFLALLGIIYIGNIYYAEKRIRETNELRRELKEIRYEFITGKTRLEDRRKQSEIAKKLYDTGVKELTVPPGKVVVPSKTETN